MDDIIKYRMNIELIVEHHLRFYEPQVVASLSKDGYDAYLAKKSVIEEIKEKIKAPDLNIESFRKYLAAKIENYENEIINSNDELEKKNLRTRKDIVQEIVKS